MKLIIKSYGSCLPCELEEFKVNGIDADIEDFGSIEREGSCFKYNCSQTFNYKLPTDEVINKYGITLADYSDICDELSEKLRVFGCGMCS